MNIQLADKENFVFRINESDYQFVKPCLLYKNFGTIIMAKVKGSTLGWNIEGGFLSYNKLKKLYHEQKKY